jgi:nitroreductase
MDLFDALYNRRSIRKYSSEKVNDDMLKSIIKAGMYAPSAVDKQPWHFIIFRDKKIIQRITAIHPNASMLVGASAGILVCFDTQLQHDEGYGPVDCSAATQNMLLAAHGLGIGACWIGIFPRMNRVKSLSEIFNLPEHVLPFSVISLGFPDQEKGVPERYDESRIHFDRW